MRKKLSWKSGLIISFLAILAVLAIVFRDDVWYVVTHVFAHEDIGEFKEFMNQKALLGSAVIIVLQMLVVLVSVLPSEPVQITAGLAYGLGMGTILCVAGVMLGCIIVYFLVNKAKYKIHSRKKAAQQHELYEQMEKSGKSKSAVIILLYLCPAIPYGLIAFLGAAIGIKWWKYFTVNLIGALGSTLFTVFFGNVIAKGNPVFSLIVTILIIIMVVFVMLYKNKLLKLIFRKRKTLDERLNAYKVKKPSRILYFFLSPVIKKRFKEANANVKYLCDIKKMEPPFLVLSNHPSINDYIYTTRVIMPRQMNIVLNRYFYHNKKLASLLKHVGGIPKRLFQSDINATKNILSCIKEGRIVSLAPEGINSVSGAGKDIIPSTVKLIKHLKVPVISVTHKGAFITLPKWNNEHGINKGRIDTEVDILFSKEEVASLTEKEILDRTNERLRFDDFKWARENKVYFEAVNRAKNLHHALYLCPKCGSEFKTISGGDKIWCAECGNGAFVDNYFQLNKLHEEDVLPEDITSWYKMQQEKVLEEIQNPDFVLSEQCKVVTHDASGYKEIVKYEGTVTINTEGVSFSGADICSGEPFEIKAARGELPFVAMMYGKSFEFYSGDIFYEFVLNNGIKAGKCAIAINKIYGHYEQKKC